MLAYLGRATLAGRIRRIDLSEDHPAAVVLALGRSTALSFSSRPEKVVPGSPESSQINFLGTDLTVTPIHGKPGNLLVYTKAGRYVILFSLGNEGNYDDVVKVNLAVKGRPVRLLNDSFRAVTFRVDETPKHGGNAAFSPAREVTVLISSDDLVMTGESLAEIASPAVGQAPYSCRGCVFDRRHGVTPRLTCVKPVLPDGVRCESKGSVLTMKAVKP